MAIEYYVNPAIGNDGNSAAQAQNPATPWATIKGGLAKVDASSQACNVNVTNGTSEDVGAYMNINYNFANQVVVRPVTDPGDGVTAITLTNGAGGGALIRIYHATAIAVANIRFEHVSLPGGTSVSAVYSPVAGTITNLEFRDCSMSVSSNLAIVDIKNSTVAGLYFTRCSFSTVGSVTVRGDVNLGMDSDNCIFSDVKMIDCTFTNRQNTLFGTFTKVLISGCNFNSPAIPLYVGGQNTLSKRISHLVVEDSSFLTSGTSHVLYINGDGVVVQNCTIDTGANGDYALVTKYGNGYTCINNTCHSRKTAGTAIVAKGVTNAVFAGNTLYQHTSGAAISIYLNDGAGGVAPKNVAFVYNRIFTYDAANAIGISSIDAAGYVLVNANEYHLTGSGLSNILGTVPTAQTQAAFKVAWEVEGYTYNETLIGRGIVNRMRQRAALVA